jgi:signal transduction histidine kinase
VSVEADEAQLRAALANVIYNALEYSRGSPVHIHVDGDGTAARVVVQDDGPGIPEDEAATIFDAYTRGYSGRDVARGNGLGLFIARRIVEAHGGTLRLEPAAAGARFSFVLPIGGGVPRASGS